MRISSVLFILLVGGCRGPESREVIEVPLESNMPYQDFEFREFGKETLAPIAVDIPQEAIHLRRFLADPDSYPEIKLDIDHRGIVFISSLSNGRILILDRMDDRLIQYDLQNHSSIVVAQHGEGPGELSFSEDLIVTNDIAFVGRADRRISEFDCSKEVCAASTSIRLAVSAYSLDNVGSDSMVVLGVAPVTEAVGPAGNAAAADRKSVAVVDRNGTAGHILVSTYDTEGHWMLEQPLISQGIVRFFPVADRFLVVYKRFPYLYLFNRGGKLVDGIQLTDFILGKQKYSTSSGILEIVMRDYSFFSGIKRLRDNYAVLEVTNLRNRRVLDQLDVRDTEIEYFGLSVVDGEITYLGSTKNLKEPKTSISLIPEGLILSRNGAVYFVSR